MPSAFGQGKTNQTLSRSSIESFPTKQTRYICCSLQLLQKTLHTYCGLAFKCWSFWAFSLSAEWLCYTDYLTFQKINGLSLNIVRVSPLSKINFFKVFLLAVLKETVYTHYATLFYEAPSFKNKRKNEADWTQKQCPGRQKEMGTSWNVNLLAVISR